MTSVPLVRLDRRPPLSVNLTRWDWSANRAYAELLYSELSRGYVVAVDERRWFGYTRTLGRSEYVAAGEEVSTVMALVERALPPATSCKAMSCAGTSDTCDGKLHVDVTGYTWFEDTRSYPGAVLGHIYG
ncbi:hypothetical protein DFR74_1044 [Nocardia puris]|uniref:Uncharacterized protein n=1 Tax=Nocardia puris TaxID=208602 RepID=A0A366DMJ8_9NOCA|nr:hypothetical protein DFR74_1044 [Nocardia puris]